MIAGMRVDAAFYLQANTFRGTTTLQLQLIDLRPSLTPSRHEAADLELIDRLVTGGDLSAQEMSRLRASRNQFAACWTALERQLRQGKLMRTPCPSCGGCRCSPAAARAFFAPPWLWPYSTSGD